MPIDVDRFEAAADLRDPPTSDRIVRFLAGHADRAYTRGEIADAIDSKPETVGTNLTRLKERGLVRHREPYWAVTDDRELVVETLRARQDDTALAEFLGTEDGDAGQDHDASPDDRDRARGGGDDAETATESEVDDRSDSSAPVTTASRPHREAAAAFSERVRDRLDDAVSSLYLFGSVARGDAAGDSDVDVLAVVADDADYAAVDDQLLDVAYDVQIEHGVRVEVHSIRASEFAVRKERGDPFVRTVVEEGTVVV